MKVIAVIPIFNEESTIIQVIEGVLPCVDKIVVIDDGSVDLGCKKIKEFIQLRKKDKLHLIANDKNYGKGYSLVKGFSYALNNGFDVIVVLDGDLEHKPKDIPRLLDKIKDNDMVVAERTIYRSPLRLFLNRWANIWVKFLIPEINDTQCGFRALRAGLLKKMEIKSTDFSIELEMLLEAYKNKAKIGFISIDQRNTANSGVSLADYFKINDVFDRWFIKNNGVLDIGTFKRVFILLSSYFGLAFSRIIRCMLWMRQS